MGLYSRILFDRRGDGRTTLLPVGNELVEGPSLKDVARQDVGPKLASLLNHHDRQVGVQLLEANR